MDGSHSNDQTSSEFITVCHVDELPVGERLYVTVDEQAIVLFNIAGQIFAVGDVCSHDDGPLGDGELEGYQCVCPRHGARFDVRDGRALTLPAVVDIPSFPTRIFEGQVQLGLPVV